MIVSADFFSYFDNISPVMWKDSSILSITALNEYPVKSSKSMPCKGYSGILCSSCVSK